MQTLLPRALRNAVLLFSVGLEDDLTWFEGNKFTTLEPPLALGQHRLELKVAPATIATIVRYSTVRNHHTQNQLPSCERSDNFSSKQVRIELCWHF